MVEKGENIGSGEDLLRSVGANVVERVEFANEGKSLAVFGTGANPPHRGHRELVKTLLSSGFDEVVVIPSGPRPDKLTVNDTAPVHRAWMADTTFGDIHGARVELFDLERGEFTRTAEIDRILKEQRYAVWHVVGSDLVRGGEEHSEITQQWYRGRDLWKEANFVVANRPGFEVTSADLPPHARFIEPHIEISSSQIRERLFRHLSIRDYVVPEVEQYIKRYGLYRGVPPVTSGRYRFENGLRPFVIADRRNPRSLELSERFGKSYRDVANAVVVVGGDGMMLRAIRKHWRKRLPFVGVNAGHIGFLLNDLERPEDFFEELNFHQLPLLWVEAEAVTGQKTEGLAFNDLWVERRSGQTAWMRIAINGEEQVFLKGDGALLSTAAGSSAYARSLGAALLPHGSPLLWLCGMGVYQPENFQPVLLNVQDVVEFRNADESPGSKKRPLRGFIDGVPVRGNIRTMSARASRSATVELLFDPRFDLAKKLRAKQFAK